MEVAAMDTSKDTSETLLVVGEPLQKRELFGGAVELSLPARLVDVSQIRPVPDHVEMFVDQAIDQSVLVEILEQRADLPDANMARFHFEVLAEHN
jgi:Ran-interacting Mog1 protein